MAEAARAAEAAPLLRSLPLDQRADLTTADQPQSVARVGPVYWFFRVGASCDGLLVLSINFMGLCICNPATRQYAPLPLLYGIQPLGMYLHPPTAEYRLLLNSRHLNAQDGYYVFTLSSQPPRHLGCPHGQAPMKGTGSVLSGSLHWWMGQLIMIFNTTAETFRQMHSPIASGRADLFEMDDMLFMYIFNNVAAEVDIWVLEDYQSEVWTCKHRTLNCRLHNSLCSLESSTVYVMWWFNLWMVMCFYWLDSATG